MASSRHVLLQSLVASLAVVCLSASVAGRAASVTPDTSVAARTCRLRPPSCNPWVSLAPIKNDGQKISDYLWKYNQTWNYGFTENGEHYQVGQVQLVGNLNLNGRQAQWSQSIGPFSGPAVNGNNEWNCVDHGVINTSCSGGWQSHWNGSFSHFSFSSSQSPYLSNNDSYWFDYQWFWQAEGYPYTWQTSALTTSHFDCQDRKLAACKFN
jgi:hypothetical protein